jgi:hypothetical protein
MSTAFRPCDHRTHKNSSIIWLSTRWEPEGGTTEILNSDEMREMAVEALKVFARPRRVLRDNRSGHHSTR